MFFFINEAKVIINVKHDLYIGLFFRFSVKLRIFAPFSRILFPVVRMCIVFRAAGIAGLLRGWS